MTAYVAFFVMFQGVKFVGLPRKETEMSHWIACFGETHFLSL